MCVVHSVDHPAVSSDAVQLGRCGRTAAWAAVCASGPVTSGGCHSLLGRLVKMAPDFSRASNFALFEIGKKCVG